MDQHINWNTSRIARLMEDELCELSVDARESIQADLVPPQEILCVIGGTSEAARLWLVYDENANSATDGYLIVFDPNHEKFGLAVKSKQPGRNFTFLNLYGSFKDTLEAM